MGLPAVVTKAAFAPAIATATVAASAPGNVSAHAAAVPAMLLLLGAGCQAALVEVEQVGVGLELNLRHDVMDNPLVLLGAAAHDLDEVAGLGNRVDGILQALIIDAGQVHALAADFADPYDLAILILVGQRGVGGGAAVRAEALGPQTLVLYLLLVLGQHAVEFCNFRVIAAVVAVAILAHGCALLYSHKLAITGTY